MNFTLKIWRQKNREAEGSFKTYTVRDIPPDASLLEMLDVLNADLVRKGEEPVAFDHDCREGICGSCGMVCSNLALDLRGEVGRNLLDVMCLGSVFGGLAQYVLRGRAAHYMLTPRHEIPAPQNFRYSSLLQ